MVDPGAYNLTMKRYHRRLAAWCALLAICFVQVATAAHACTLVYPANKVQALQSSSDVPCAEMGMADTQDRTPLCVEHCKAEQKLFDHHSPVALADVPCLAPIILAFVWETDVRQVANDLLVPPDTAPPVFASSGRLRI
jgi:hypothetical protein